MYTHRKVGIMKKFMPDVNDPQRKWIVLGGDLEASYDGERYVDIRSKSKKQRIFISLDGLKKAINLFGFKPI